MNLLAQRGTMILLAVLLDLLLGERLPIVHPVVLMGKEISFLEKRLHPGTKDEGRRRTPRKEIFAGAILTALVVLSVFFATFALLFLCERIHPMLRFCVETFFCYQCIAIRGMTEESRAVFLTLRFSTLENAKKAVGRIVGRDTSVLDEKGIIRAAVETVAEGLCDGVIAPLFYMTFGGAVLAMAYKAINTMDSMIGYQNEKYLYFGRCAAKLDDGANFFPARIAAMLLLLSGFLLKGDAKGGYRIWKRDRFCHASPNSAQTESVMAGLLGVRLAGPAVYFGRYVEKPYIGDALREVRDADILLANRFFLLASFLGAVLGAAVAFFLIMR